MGRWTSRANFDEMTGRAEMLRSDMRRGGEPPPRIPKQCGRCRKPHDVKDLTYTLYHVRDPNKAYWKWLCDRCFNSPKIFKGRAKINGEWFYWERGHEHEPPISSATLGQTRKDEP